MRILDKETTIEREFVAASSACLMSRIVLALALPMSSAWRIHLFKKKKKKRILALVLKSSLAYVGDDVWRDVIALSVACIASSIWRRSTLL